MNIVWVNMSKVNVDLCKLFDSRIKSLRKMSLRNLYWTNG